MKLSARDRRAAILGGGGLVLILLVRFGVMPWIDDWGESRRIAAEARAERSDLELGIWRVLAQQQRLEEAYGPGVGRPLADADAARMSLFEAGQKILKGGGFEVSDYLPQSPRPLPQVPGVQVVPLQIRGKCRLPQLARCIADMRKAETLVMVEKVSVTNDQKEPGKLDVTIVLATLGRMGGAGT